MINIIKLLAISSIIISTSMPSQIMLSKGASFTLFKTEMITNGMNRYQWHVFEQLAASLKGRHNTLCTGRQALATLESMHEIIKER